MGHSAHSRIKHSWTSSQLRQQVGINAAGQTIDQCGQLSIDILPNRNTYGPLDRHDASSHRNPAIEEQHTNKAKRRTRDNPSTKPQSLILAG